ncbi:hypothetical protein Emag_005542 [Eimeria magna]
MPLSRAIHAAADSPQARAVWGWSAVTRHSRSGLANRATQRVQRGSHGDASSLFSALPCQRYVMQLRAATADHAVSAHSGAAAHVRGLSRLSLSRAGPASKAATQAHGPLRRLDASSSMWQAATAAAAAAKRRQQQQQKQQQQQQQESGLAEIPFDSAGGPAAAAAAKSLSHPRAMDGLYVSSFYVTFLAAAHAASPAAIAATAAAAEATAKGGPHRLRGALQKRQAAAARLQFLAPSFLPSLAHVAATAASMQCNSASSSKGPSGPRRSEPPLWERELAAVLAATSAAAAAAADNAFWAAFCVAAAAAAPALMPSEVARLSAAAAAAAAAGAPGWMRLHAQQQLLLGALLDHARRLLTTLETLQQLYAVPSVAQPAATAARSAAATAAAAAAAAFPLFEDGGAQSLERRRPAAPTAAAAAGAEALHAVLPAAERALHSKLTEAAAGAQRAAAAAAAAASAVQDKAAAAAAGSKSKQSPDALCKLLLRALRIFAAAAFPCPALLHAAGAALTSSRCSSYRPDQLLELMELMVRIPKHDEEHLGALHAITASFETESILSSLQTTQIVRLLRASQALGAFSSSAAAGALDRLGAPPIAASRGAPVSCTVPPQAAEAAALQAVAAAAVQQQQQQQQEQQQQLLRRCIRAYKECLADAEAGEAAAATAPPSFEAKDQSTVLLLRCLVQQQALDRPSLLRLLPGLLLELQQQQQQQQQQGYLQSCGLVLTALASCGVHLLHVWGAVLAPLLQPAAALQSRAAAAAGCGAAVAKPWGAWLVSRPLLQHVEASLAAAVLCSVAAAGGLEEQQREELLRAAAAAADHAAAASVGFLRLLQHNSSSSGTSSSSSNAGVLRQLTDEAFGELAKNVCGFVRLHGAAQRLLHCMQHPHPQLQQQQQHQLQPKLQEQRKQQPQDSLMSGDKGKTTAAADTPERSHPLCELLRVHLPEVQFRKQEQQQQQQQPEQEQLQQQLQQQEDLNDACASPLLRTFLLAASRGAAKCSKGLQTSFQPAAAAAADGRAPFVSSSRSSSSSSTTAPYADIACVPELLRVVSFEEEETSGSPVLLQLLLELLLQLPAADCMHQLAAAVTHFGEHVGACLHAASLQERRLRLRGNGPVDHSGFI